MGLRPPELLIRPPLKNSWIRPMNFTGGTAKGPCGRGVPLDFLTLELPLVIGHLHMTYSLLYKLVSLS